jgi:hypothetical protein
MPVPVDELVGHLDDLIDHVAMNLDITGTLLRPDGVDYFVQLVSGAQRVG